MAIKKIIIIAAFIDQFITRRVVNYKAVDYSTIKNAIFNLTKKVRKLEVNTLVVPGKNKTRSTKSGIISGVKSGYKKALVTVAEGETIDLYASL